MAELSTLGAVIKTAYEGEANTNAFTDSEKSKLESLENITEIAWTDVTEKPTEFNPTSHTHTISDITGLTSALENIEIAWDDVTEKPETFTPASHTHTISDVTGLQSALNSKPTGTGITSIVSISQSAYDALAVKDPETLYVING